MNVVRMRHIALLCLLQLFLTNPAWANENVRYRYYIENSEGNKIPVVTNTLPAHHAQNGYEIIDLNSNVLKVVPPAPSKDDVEKAQKEREALATFEILKRRYSSIDDIERAKQRRLSNIDTNISILKGNISNLELSIEDLISQAATQERAGRKVPKHILDRLSDTKAELRISQDLLAYRQGEHRDTAKKFDDDIRAFILGESIYKKLNPGEDR